MSIIDTKAIVYIALANDRSGAGEGYLAELTREKNGIIEVFRQAEASGLVRLLVNDNASAEDIFEAFNAPENKDKIAIFHYAGHASGQGLHLELEHTSGNRLANASGLSGLFANQKQLKLVFLNGCSTKEQVSAFMSAKIPNIVATRTSIDDTVAVTFAHYFYQALAGYQTIQQAFDNAQNFYKTQYGGQLRGEKRLWKVEEAEEAIADNALPWELHAAEPEWSISKIKVIAGPQPNVNVFVAYGDDDKPMAAELFKHLNIMQRNKVIDAYDGTPLAGSDKEAVLRERLSQARIILLCLSANFFASDYCDLIEDMARQRRNENSAIVVPILFKNYDLTDYEFSKFQALPFNGKPVSSWQNKDEAFTEISRGLKQLITAMAKPTDK